MQNKNRNKLQKGDIKFEKGNMICTSGLILIVTYFGLVFGSTLIPEQETTSLWNVYYKRGFYIASQRGKLLYARVQDGRPFED